MNDIAYKSAIELRTAMLNKELSAVEVMEATLTRMAQLEPSLNAFVTRTEEAAMASARDADRRLALGEAVGLLHGLPISVKDLIHVGGVPTTFGSRAMIDNVAAADAPSVEKARSAGACIIGKTTTTEFGCKAGGGDSPLTGITRNAWDLTRTTGGSSAGAATTVAAGITPFSLGTDGGGSLRIPGSLCGLFAIKAQYGRVPVFPTSATPTLGHVGPLARTVRDAALLLQSISGFDNRDPAGVSEAVPDFLAACDAPVKGMRVAWSPTLGYARPDSEIVEMTAAAARVFEQMGCIVEQVDQVFERDPVEMWGAEFYAGVGTRLKPVLANSRELLDPAVADILDTALEQSIDEYYSQVFARYDFREHVRSFFGRYDLLLTPTLPVAAFEAGRNVPGQLSDRNIVSWVYYTYPFNLSGNPAASIPCGFTKEGLPIGLQIVSGTNRESDIFRAAAAFEAVRPWAHRKPQLPF